MRPLLSPVLATQDVARQQIYTVLLAEPGCDWTVASIAKRLPHVAVNDVRTTLHLQLGDRLVDIEPVARQRSPTLRLTGDGEQILTALLRERETGGSGQAAPAARGGRDVQ